MSILGTGVAAAVANTASQAQQVARQRDRVHAQSVQDAHRLHDLVEAHMQALEEGEELQASDEFRINDQPQQHQSPQRDTPEQHAQSPDEPAAGLSVTTDDAIPLSDAPGAVLYRHVDVQA